MSIKSAMRTYLASKTGVTAIVGTAPARIYPVVVPQGELRPAITYRRMSGAHEHNLKGSTGSAMPRFRLDCWAKRYEDADVLAEAVRQVMQGFSGTMDDTHVDSVLLDDDFDDYEPPQDAGEEGTFHITLDYRIRYTESIPTFS